MSGKSQSSLASKFAGAPSRRGSSLSGLLSNGGAAAAPVPPPADAVVDPLAGGDASPAIDDSGITAPVDERQEQSDELHDSDEVSSPADEAEPFAEPDPSETSSGSDAAGRGAEGTATGETSPRGRRRGTARKPASSRRTPVYFDAATAEKLRAATRTGGRTYADLAALAFRSVPASELPALFEPDDAGGDEIPMSEPRGGRGTELQFHFSAAQLAWIKRAQDTCRVKSRSDFIATVVSAYLSRSRA